MDAWPFRSGTFADLVIRHVGVGNRERAYHYFWQMLDSMRTQPLDEIITERMRDAVGALCHGSRKAGSWTWEEIPRTMERAQTLIAHLEAGGIDADEMKRLHLMHPILAAAYVEHAMRRSCGEMRQMVRAFADESPIFDAYVAHVYTYHRLCHSAVPAIDRLRLFVREVRSLDVCVGAWKYLIGLFNWEEWEVVLRSTLEQAEVPELPMLEWLLAVLHEQREEEAPGIHLARLGFIPKRCWQIAGPFEGEHLPTSEEAQLMAAFSQNNGQDADGREISRAGTSHLPLLRFSPIPPFALVPRERHQAGGLEWRTVTSADDFRNGYLDCRRMFETETRVCAYAWAVLESPTERGALFQIGYNDRVSVWLNGDLRFRGEGSNPAVIDGESFSGTLRRGVNHLLVRVANIEPGWGFILRLGE